MRRRWTQLAAARDGTTTVELAIVMLALILLIFGIIEWGRLLWTRQAVMHAADAAARCYSIGSPLCTGANTPDAYAVTVASNDGITLSATNVSFTPTTRSSTAPCTVAGGSPQYYQISVSYTFSSPMTALLGLPTTFSISSKYAC